MVQQYQPLFLKYRPQSLSQLIGQEYVARTLSNAIEYDRISHAYLFTGPRGTGKTSTARILAKSLNCEIGPTPHPCETCNACVEIRQGISPAVLEIDAASNNSVDDARVLIERAPLVAQGGRFKLYIVDECHMLTKEAFNALLKTIEEPPPNVIFILATTEEHKVPPTIISRCQRLMFRLVNQSSLIEHLRLISTKEKFSITQDAIELIARRSQGGLRDALGLLDQASLFGSIDNPVCAKDLYLLVGALNEDIVFGLSEAILQGDGKKGLTLVNQLLLEGREPYLIAGELAKHMLNLAKASFISPLEMGEKEEFGALITGSPEYIDRLNKVAHSVDRTELAQIVESLDRLEQNCRRSSQPVLNLEIGLLSLCHRLDFRALASMQDRLDQIDSQLLEMGISPHLSHTGSEPKLSRSESSNTEDTKSDWRDPLGEPIVTERIREDEPSGNGITVERLEEIWAEILDELEKKHLPTFSLVSTHAFPVGFENDILTIGVLVENFQKMIENKIEHIKNVATRNGKLSDRLQIRVKVVSDEVERKGKAKSRQGNSGSKPAINKEPRNGFMREQEQSSEETESPKSPLRPSQGVPEAEVDLQDPGREAAKEAYKLFEGPGSRLIVPNQ